jgi:transcription initiation factor IIF auxiliary subunit
MRKRFQLLLGVGCVGLLLTAMASPAAAQEISAANTSRYTGDGRWDWTIFIKATAQILGEVRCVEYKLHPTFPNPNRRVCSLGDTKQPFSLRGSGWGTFEIPITVIFKSGKTRLLKHKLQFVSPSVQQALPIRADNTAKEVRPDWWNWTVFIQGPDDVLDQVKCVEYTLHPTFLNPVRDVCERGTGPAFALSANGWGTFQIRIRVFLKDGRVQELTHKLKLE